MQTLVIYDIPEDRARNRVSEACKDYGLKRIQWSAFQGDLNHNRRQELRYRLSRILQEDESQGNIQLFPICDKDIRLRVELDKDGNIKTKKEEGKGYARG